MQTQHKDKFAVVLWETSSRPGVDEYSIVELKDFKKFKKLKGNLTREKKYSVKHGTKFYKAILKSIGNT